MSRVIHTLDGVRFRTISKTRAKGEWSSRVSLTSVRSVHDTLVLPEEFNMLPQHEQLRLLAAACRKIGLRMQPCYRRAS